MPFQNGVLKGILCLYNKGNPFFKSWPLLRIWTPSKHAASVQHLPNVVETSVTFGQRWTDVVITSRVHLAEMKAAELLPLKVCPYISNTLMDVTLSDVFVLLLQRNCHIHCLKLISTHFLLFVTRVIFFLFIVWLGERIG